jgi:tetratricopeptide (TPR) repeat protein
LRDDAAIRSQSIAFEEKRIALDAQDQITPRMLAGQYMQRYREHGDVGDILRAQAMAERSLRIQTVGNVAGLTALAEAQLALHDFKAALVSIRAARAYQPTEPGLAMFEASLDLELGDMADAKRLVEHFGGGLNVDTEAIAARIDELTGHLADARRLEDRASHRLDASYDQPAERRAWFHTRLGEMAFNAGDTDDALAEEHTALARYPLDAQAYTDLARDEAALGKWSDAGADAQKAVDLVPSPENLGLLADAQAQAGKSSDAAATRDEIVAVERIGNTQHLVDRLLAMYDADHHINGDDAYAIARRELAVRDDLFAEDTLAWTAAQDGKWDVARKAAGKATQYNTEDGRIWYHAGVIAEHFGDKATAKADYQHALALNPHFQAVLADDARARLARL